LSRHDREDEKAVERMTAIRALLSNIVDYAGLFPPASLDMPTAMRNYLEYREDAASWMLGRFVAPIARLGELREELGRGFLGRSVPISGIAGSAVDADIASARAFNADNAGVARVEIVEARLATPDSIERAAANARGEVELFAEVPIEPDPKTLIEAVARAGISAKIRTGGTTPDAFPSASAVVRFIRRCLEAGVPFKATAGLHHPVRAEYPLTYDADAPRGMMFGYLNVFVAAALMRDGLSDDDAMRALAERDRAKFEIQRDAVAWEGHSLSADELRRIRDGFAVSFGSCSFREPVDELHTISSFS
jgi:hypothetical protein